MKVLVADTFEREGIEGLEAAGCVVTYKPELKDETLLKEIGESKPDVLVVRGSLVDEKMLDSGSIKLVVRAGAGFNTIDVGAASRRGIYVSNCPGMNSIAVAEIAFGLILSLDRRIPDNVISLRAGDWNKKEFSKARGLYGRTIGLVGLGSIGREMIPRARGFGMKVCGWSRKLTPERALHLGIEFKKDILELARSSDVVSVHLALNDQTRGLLGTEFFGAMREGAYFVNTSRAEVVDESAYKLLFDKGCRIGLDVFHDEPKSAQDRYSNWIVNEKNVYGTHHIGASTDQAQLAIAFETVRVIATYMETGKVPNAVNLAERSPATHTLVVRHRDRPGVLANVLESIRSININVQEMENIIFEGAEAAVARINLDLVPPDTVINRLKADPNIIEINLFRLR
jgi:D-3-phosphoglycerate dehydrogenase / 2-oxoglutarate reductase